MAVIGRDKRDPSLLVAHCQDENFEYPIVHGRLEFSDKGGDDFIPTLVFCPIVDETKDLESQRRIADKLKALIIDTLKLPIRFQWDPDGELLGLVSKDGKRALLPLPPAPPQLIKPDSII